MTDRITPQQRSLVMAAVASRETSPERMVRRLVHALGFRFRLHRPGLPGRPDLTFPKLKKVIFVHGCFWHQHKGCGKARLPVSNVEYWQEKFKRNSERDAAAI